MPLDGIAQSTNRVPDAGPIHIDRILQCVRRKFGALSTTQQQIETVL